MFLRSSQNHDRERTSFIDCNLELKRKFWRKWKSWQTLTRASVRRPLVLKMKTLFERVSKMRVKFENLINISRFRIKKNEFEVRFSSKFEILDFDKKRRIHVAIMYKKKIQKIQLINSSISNDFTSEDRMNWRKKAIIRKKAFELNWSRELYDHFIIFKFFDIKREFRLTSKRLKTMKIENDFWLEEKILLFNILYNREKALVWNFSKIKTISKKMNSSIQIRTISHETWQIFDFSILKTLMNEVKKMIRERLAIEILKYCHEFYRNSWFLIKKKEKRISIDQRDYEYQKDYYKKC